MTEKEFITAIQNHTGIIHKILYLYVDDPEDKRDLKQEIQLQAWRAKDRFRGDSQFSTWLYRVALNTVFTFNRKRKITSTSLDSTVEPIHQVPEKTERSELLMRAIKGLNDVDKTIVTLHLEDYDNGEIADITGLSKNNVGVKLHRIKEALKKKLNEKAQWTN
ncbi:RNA polymerase sigma factor [Marinoscillum sp.]|uniref:RNA polymerase sigma factor n=1 Tax=Marinoscillum sp. TaxID=2024838 RepID=UPI003BAA6313